MPSIWRIPIADQQMSNEWYTPAKYIEAARTVMGSIDLDPASCELANQTVKATRYYTQEDDGLSKAWYGNVWLNPPYSHPAASRQVNVNGGGLKGYTGYFMSKFIEEYAKGHVNQAVICVNADTTRTWFKPLWDGIICFAHHQIQFDLPDRTQRHHFYSTVFAYFGWNEQRFIDVFSQFGRIAKAVDVPVAKPRQLELVP